MAVSPPALLPAAGKTPNVPSVDESTAKLAARLEKSGGTSADWQLLGKSYEFLGRKAEAEVAFARANGKTVAAAPTSAHVFGTINLAPAMKAKLPAAAILFVLAKVASAGGPPLAVIRIEAPAWPVRFSLDDSNAMMPALNLSSATKVTVEARLSASGNPIAQPGDLSGSVANVDPRKNQALAIVIDHLVR
jgi:cytochrome c-type biogenesis protein CcmH